MLYFDNLGIRKNERVSAFLKLQKGIQKVYIFTNSMAMKTLDFTGENKSLVDTLLKSQPDPIFYSYIGAPK